MLHKQIKMPYFSVIEHFSQGKILNRICLPFREGEGGVRGFILTVCI
jgi:hypothetical protein